MASAREPVFLRADVIVGQRKSSLIMHSLAANPACARCGFTSASKLGIICLRVASRLSPLLLQQKGGKGDQ